MLSAKVTTPPHFLKRKFQEVETFTPRSQADSDHSQRMLAAVKSRCQVPAEHPKLKTKSVFLRTPFFGKLLAAFKHPLRDLPLEPQTENWAQHFQTRAFLTLHESPFFVRHKIDTKDWRPPSANMRGSFQLLKADFSKQN